MTFAWWHVLVALIPILPNLWSIWHIWNHRFSSFQQKAIWLVIAVFLPVLGGLIYIFAGRKHAGEKLYNGRPRLYEQQTSSSSVWPDLRHRHAGRLRGSEQQQCCQRKHVP